MKKYRIGAAKAATTSPPQEMIDDKHGLVVTTLVVIRYFFTASDGRATFPLASIVKQEIVDEREV